MRQLHSVGSMLRSLTTMRAVALLLLVLCSGLPRIGFAVNVTTRSYDNFRTGWNWQEATLTPNLLKSGQFGLIATVSIPLLREGDRVDAQPLVMSSQSINGVVYPIVVYVVTEGNGVYAIDGSTGAILANRYLETPAVAAKSACTDSPVGINSTPVIDMTQGTLYVVIATQQSCPGTILHYLHALSTSTLADQEPPLLITYPTGTSDNRQRPALTLFNGGVLIPFGSFDDVSPTMTLGYLAYANIHAESQVDFSTTTAAQELASIWMSGAGPAASANGIYFATGNGSGTVNPPSGTVAPPPPTGPTNLPESLVELTGSAAGAPLSLTYAASFSLPNYGTLDNKGAPEGGDGDFGSGGVLIVPSGAPSSITASLPAEFVIAMGKYDGLYVVNPTTLAVVQTPTQNQSSAGQCWCGSSYFTGSDGVGYVVNGANYALNLYKVSAIGLTPVRSTGQMTSTTTNLGLFSTISSNGTSSGSQIIWTVSGPDGGGHLYLHAFSATNLAPLLCVPAGVWSYGADPNTVPVVADEHVYIASEGELTIFGVTRPKPHASCTPWTPAVQHLLSQ